MPDSLEITVDPSLYHRAQREDGATVLTFYGQGKSASLKAKTKVYEDLLERGWDLSHGGYPWSDEDPWLAILPDDEINERQPAA